MQKITVPKKKLLEILKVNREKHKTDFDAAHDVWRTDVIEAMQKNLDDAKAGKKPETYIHLDEPKSQLDEYDTIIGMLELATEFEVMLDSREYSQYVQDKWIWKEHFYASNSGYLSKAGR